MIEKVNPSHPDKISDRIAGAIVDLAYKEDRNPKIAVEVLIGHANCYIIVESNVNFERQDLKMKVMGIVDRIVGDYMQTRIISVQQDEHLADNQKDEVRCGDNGIFKGMPLTAEEKELSQIARDIYAKFQSDGKYILADNELIICQSNAKYSQILTAIDPLKYDKVKINPLGEWTGGTNVDTGATNRKLGSDMGRSVTGGGLCLSADTEFISDDLCWHRMDSYKDGMKVGQWNNGKLEFVKPLRYIHNQNDYFIEFENDTKLSMKLTPYHEMLIKTSKGNLIKRKAYEIADKLANKVGNSGSVIHNFTFENAVKKSKYKDENELRLQIAFCADGTILENCNKWTGRIRVKREQKKQRLRELLQGRDYKETADGEFSIFWVKPRFTNKSLYECCSQENLSIVYDEVFNWDGDKERRLFRTTHKVDADFIQFVIASMGKVATITIDDRFGEIKNGYEVKSNCYCVHELKSTTTGLRCTKGTPITVNYLEEKEPSYCFEVPTHNLVVRHNDRIFVTGNCGKDLSKADVAVNIYAFLKAQETGKPVELHCAIGDTEIDGKPYSEIVAVARKYIDKIGGFEKLAEWGLF